MVCVEHALPEVRQADIVLKALDSKTFEKHVRFLLNSRWIARGGVFVGKSFPDKDSLKFVRMR